MASSAELGKFKISSIKIRALAYSPPRKRIQCSAPHVIRRKANHAPPIAIKQPGRISACNDLKLSINYYDNVQRDMLTLEA
jgi:hypothetical protein